MASIPRFDAAGNVYAVVAWEEADARSDGAWAAAACRDGAADGVLIEAPAGDGVAAGVRIVNPDGSRAEMSGNGLRIFAHWLWREGRVAVEEPFEVDTGTRQVTCRVAPGGGSVRVALGPVRVEAPREIDVGETSWGLVRFTPVNVGNPHAVLVTEGPGGSGRRGDGPACRRPGGGAPVVPGSHERAVRLARSPRPNRRACARVGTRCGVDGLLRVECVRRHGSHAGQGESRRDRGALRADGAHAGRITAVRTREG